MESNGISLKLTAKPLNVNRIQVTKRSSLLHSARSIRTIREMTTATVTTEYLLGEIRAELARQRLSQADLGERLGETQGWVSRRLAPGAGPTSKLDDAVRMCVALNLNMAKLLADAPPEPVENMLDRRTLRKQTIACDPPVPFVPFSVLDLAA